MVEMGGGDWFSPLNTDRVKIWKCSTIQISNINCKKRTRYHNDYGKLKTVLIIHIGKQLDPRHPGYLKLSNSNWNYIPKGSFIVTFALFSLKTENFVTENRNQDSWKKYFFPFCDYKSQSEYIGYNRILITWASFQIKKLRLGTNVELMWQLCITEVLMSVLLEVSCVIAQITKTCIKY